MMVSVETVLLRGKRRADQLLAVPGVRAAGEGLLYLGGGLLLSGASLWGRMQPIALGLICGTAGWRCVCTALGSVLGYRLFWGSEGYQGAVWALGGMVLALLLPFLGGNRRERLAASAGCLVSAAGLFFQYRMGDMTPTLHFLLRIGVGAGCTWLSGQLGKNRLSLWMGTAVGVMALSNIRLPTWCSPGYMAAGALAAAAPLPAAALAGIGADIGHPTAVTMTGVACLAWYLQLLPIRERWRRLAAPGIACLMLMVLQGRWDWGTLVCVAAGGAAGALIPWHITAVPRHSGMGAVQVQLEQTAGVLTCFQRQLLEYAPPPLDENLLLEQLKENTCAVCTIRETCREKAMLDVRYLSGSGEFPCRKSAQMSQFLNQARDQLKRMKRARAQQGEYRSAVVQQYGFLADVLHRLADRLPERQRGGKPRYRVLVSARSRGRELAEGDAVTAFPGQMCRYYVLLCDGMGTGLGAQEEGQQASRLLKQMLTAGLPPASALGGLNSQLTLLGRAGAVTVDLAEIRLDSGSAWLYKWGANPSWLLRRGRARQIGVPSPPPGMDVSRFRENTGRLTLTGRETLVMVSDGISGLRAQCWAKAAETMEPGILAGYILDDGGSREDDATAVVIRVVSLEGAG